jgi:hypothetical protein
MKKSLALFALMACGSISAFAGEWSGVISDSKCNHKDASEKSAACAQKCINGGADAVLVSGDQIYTIDKASMDKVTPHIGHQVTVTGKVDGKILTVESIKM